MNRRHLPHIPTLHPAGPLADTDLLARFIETHDEVAFELLVRRHAPMVLAACRRMLADANDADDAFQATFLVLARKAGSVARGEVLAGWLHRVACRAALRIRADRARRPGSAECNVEQLPAPPFDFNLCELERVLDEELAKLPERHRAAFVLCCLEGKTGEEASRLLGCPPGTVSSRLTRARERLRDRLTQRGFAPALITATLAAVAEAAIASALPTLIESALRAAPDFAARRSTPALSTTRSASIAEGVIRTMSTTKLKSLALLLVASLFAAGGVFAATQPDKGEPPVQPPPKVNVAAATAPAAPVVQLVRPQRGGLERIATHAGNVQPFEQVEMHPVVAGILKRVEVDIGDRVKRGQVLAEIDAPALAVDEKLAAVGVEQAKSLLLEAEARTTAARIEINSAKGAVKQRETEVDAAKANLTYRKKQFERARDLVKQGAADSRIQDEAESNLRAAEAQIEGAIAAVESAKGDIAVKDSKLLQAEAGVRTAKVNIESARLILEKAQIAVAQTKIAAPFDGVVTRRNYNSGSYVRPGERGADGVMFTLMRVDIVRVVVAVPERVIPLTEVGVPAEVTIDAYPSMKVSGKVARLGFAVDASKGTMRVEIDIPNPKGDIRPGMTGAVTLRLGKGSADALRLPQGAVVQVLDPKTGETTAVYVYRNGKARLTPVRVSYSSGKELEIASGLTADDVVVLTPKDLVPKVEVEVDVDKTVPPK